MNAETFFQSFDLLAEAPNSVAKLRELILELAIRGKLLSQDPSDGDSTKLFDLLRNALGRADAGERDIVGVVGLPPSWGLCRLNSIAEVLMGNSPPGEFYNDAGKGVPLVNGPVEFSPGPFGLTVRSKFTTQPTKFCKKGDLLICVRGSTTGRTNIAAFDACIGRGVAALRATPIQPWLNLVIWSMRNSIFSQGTGSTFPSVSLDKISDLQIPLPPLAEQRRIVSKVDELLGLCDELETRQGARRELRERLVQAALDQLLASRDPAEFDTNWQRIQEHFDILFRTSKAVAGLRKAILELAFNRRLVAVDVSKTEKVDTGVIGDFVQFQNGYAFKSEWFVTRGIRLLRNANIGIGELDWNDVEFVSEERAKEFARFSLETDDIVISLDRPLISKGLKIARLDSSDLPALLLQRVARAQFVDDRLLPEYFYLWLNGPAFVNSIDPGRSNGVPHISTKDIQRIPILVPSLSEQRHIISRVVQLMCLCDELESRIAGEENGANRLVSAAARELLTLGRQSSKPWSPARDLKPEKLRKATR